MRNSEFSEDEIISILQAAHAGRTVEELCREHQITDATFYQWKAKYGGMEATDLRRFHELEDENRRLKQMYADLLLKIAR